MNTFSRIKRIIQAAIGDIVEKARDPELELAQYVEDVELRLGEVRAERKEVEARRAHLAVQAAEYRRSAEEWMAKTEAAAARDEDDLAREALRRHHVARRELASYEERLAEADAALAPLRRDEEELEEKLKEAREEQRRLSMKLRRAEAERESAAALTGAGRPTTAKDRVREKIMDAEAESEARRELYAESPEGRIGAREAHGSLDEELAEIKRKVKKGSTGGA